MTTSEQDKKQGPGRPRVEPIRIDIALQLRTTGMSFRDIEIVTGVSRTSIWRYEHEKDKQATEELEG